MRAMFVKRASKMPSSTTHMGQRRPHWHSSCAQDDNPSDVIEMLLEWNWRMCVVGGRNDICSFRSVWNWSRGKFWQKTRYGETQHGIDISAWPMTSTIPWRRHLTGSLLRRREWGYSELDVMAPTSKHAWLTKFHKIWLTELYQSIVA